MTIPTLGTLIEVDLREAWNHETHSFTPWLADNLDALADKIGIPLELEGQEVLVETFAADILARNPLDNSLVLIENSYPEADSPLRPDVGIPKQKRKQLKTYRYDPSLSPALEWDNNPAREQAKTLITEILNGELLLFRLSLYAT